MWAGGMRNCVSRPASAPSRDLADMAGEAAGTRGEERNDGNDAGVESEGLVRASLSLCPCSSRRLEHQNVSRARAVLGWGGWARRVGVLERPRRQEADFG